MAARKRSQERDFNRRRWMVLDKGFDRAYNQKDTAFGECLLKWNVKEEAQLQRRQKLLQRQGDISLGYREQEKKLFVVTRDQAIREPTLILERTPSAEQYPDFVDLKQPRFMRPLKSRQAKTPEFSTFSVFQAVKKRKRNPWEDAVKEAVQFRPTLCPCARLNPQDTEKLLTDWVVVNEKQTKTLGLGSDNRSAPVRRVRTGPNPLNLPPRLNSRLHHLAQDLLDDFDDRGDGGSYTESDASSENGSETEITPVFVTQLPNKAPVAQVQGPIPVQPQQQQQPQSQQQPHHHQQHEFILFEARDDTKKEQLNAQKQQVDTALASIYEMLDRRRAAGRPRITHAIRQQHSEDPAASAADSLTESPSRVSTASTALRFPIGGLDRPINRRPLRTTCRTAESIRILSDARKNAGAAAAEISQLGRANRESTEAAVARDFK